jgi:molybdopterin converting factor small subunit
MAGGHAQVEVKPSSTTLQHALESLFESYPGMRDRILTEQGTIREHVNLFVGSENVRAAGGLATPVPDGAEVSIIPAISGGSSLY